MAERSHEAGERRPDAFVVVEDRDHGCVLHQGPSCRRAQNRASGGGTRTLRLHVVARNHTDVCPSARHAPSASASAWRTRSASVRTPIFRMTLPRWIFTVISLSS